MDIFFSFLALESNMRDKKKSHSQAMEGLLLFIDKDYLL